MTSPVVVRRARREDAEAIERLITPNVATGELLPRTAEFIAEHADDFLVVEVAGAVAGSVHLDEYAPSLAEVRSLAVDPAFQGLGIGSALVAALEELAARREIHTVFAVTNSEAFFRARGYEARHIPELDRERSEVSKYKGVYAKELLATQP